MRMFMQKHMSAPHYNHNLYLLKRLHVWLIFFIIKLRLYYDLYLVKYK